MYRKTLCIGWGALRVLGSDGRQAMPGRGSVPPAENITESPGAHGAHPAPRPGKRVGP